MKNLTWLWLVVWVLSAAPALARAIEDYGSYPVGWRDVVFVDENFGRGSIRGRIYYPALKSGPDAPPNPDLGPYPLTAFQHGYASSPLNYDELNIHTASWGFVVASIGTQVGNNATRQDEARDSRALLHWVDDESRNPASFLYQMSWQGQWGAVGHSMGGAALMYLIAYEPRVSTIVPLSPARGPRSGGSIEGSENLAIYTGSAFFVSGDVDTIVPKEWVRSYFEEAVLARRNFYTNVLGMGHNGPSDNVPNSEPLPAEDQQRLNRRFATGFLRAEMLGEQNLYVDLMGEGARVEPLEQESASLEPALWVAPSRSKPGVLVVGMAGTRGQEGQFGYSTALAAAVTPFGVLGLDPELGDFSEEDNLRFNGVLEEEFLLADYNSGSSLYFQGLAQDDDSGTLTRVDTYIIP
ncbi:hypothetical protein [Candidatus Cyanaurora vandensis]|uniref:alpha/beta hydrolase family protein n=2 Tax=Candidatus Cyanaurora vandensis TaxID=2714958 RepID=UPI00257AFD5F|nr:hypothetical protein [Candidatus Cyanaurora vandensis]